MNAIGISLDLAVASGSKTLRQAFNETFNTNVTSTHLFTHKFLSLLIKSPSPRLIFISSSVGSLAWQKAQTYPTDAPSPPGWPKEASYNITTYRTSKTAMNMMILEWKRVLYHDGVKVFAVNPGYLATGLNGTENSLEEMKGSGARDVSLGGEFVRKVVEGDRDDDEGKLIEEGRVVDW
jgi:NAD(P)-dependent dehydrogenase (short-subunit alcohol dehydrogenase family)